MFAVARPDGRHVWVNFAHPLNDTIDIVDTLTLKVIHRFAPGPAVLHMEFTPRGNEVWVSVRDADRVDVYDAATFAKKGQIPAQKAIGHFLHRTCNEDWTMSPDPAELTLVDRWQHNFPLVDKPFEVVGRAAALNEREAIGVFRRLHEIGVISRIGAVVRPNTVGASTLAALQVPPERLEEVAAIVSREPLVTHNYERTHALNLWFVIAGADANAIAATIESIRQQTGLAAIDLPMLKAYHLGLGFPLGTARPGERGSRPVRAATISPIRAIARILAAIEDGLPLVEQPYRAVAEQLDLDQAEIIDRLDHLAAAGIVTRFGCVVRHDKLGFNSNAMAVWDVPDDMVDSVAASFTRNPHVTLCYRRPRHLPLWPYNIFCMIHAKARHDAYAVIDEINLLADTGLEQAGGAVFDALLQAARRGVLQYQAEG